MSKLVKIEPEYIYVTIPAEYICVYHRILAMMADYGEEMLKDCKASCTDRNNNVIECFNMFNAAVAARKLGKDKLAETLIKYIKAKINQIYRGLDNSTSFVFPVDETGQLKAFVSCGERPQFEIDLESGQLLAHKLDNGFDEHFHLGPEDETQDKDDTGDEPKPEVGLVVEFIPRYEKYGDDIVPCGDLYVRYNGVNVNPNDCIVAYYFDDIGVKNYNSVRNPSTGEHRFTVVVTYKKVTRVTNVGLEYNPNKD